MIKACRFLKIAVVFWVVEFYSGSTVFADSAERIRITVARSLANEQAFDGFECRFAMREGVANSEEAAAQGKLSELWNSIEGKWARKGAQEWLVGNPVVRNHTGMKLVNWIGAHATDGQFWLKVGPGVAMIEPNSNVNFNSRPIFSGSPWCSLGFLGGSRSVNCPATFFQSVQDSTRFRDGLSVTEAGSGVELESEAAEGSRTQVARAVFDNGKGTLPVRYVKLSATDGVQTMHFESRILESKVLANGCVFPTSVVAYYHPTDSHPHFRVVTFQAKGFSQLDPGTDPLVFTAEDRIQLHNNVDDYVSSLAPGEKVYLSSLPGLAGRVKEANIRKMVGQEPSGIGVLGMVAIVLVVFIIPSAWFWYARTR